MNSDDIIESIVQQYPEAEWLDRCRAELPQADDGYIMSVIEILNGGDVLVVE
jgi:hypothetical protein